VAGLSPHNRDVQAAAQIQSSDLPPASVVGGRQFLSGGLGLSGPLQGMLPVLAGEPRQGNLNDLLVIITPQMKHAILDFDELGLDRKLPGRVGPGSRLGQLEMTSTMTAAAKS